MQKHSDVISALFSPYLLKGLLLPNRLVMAPMTRRFSPGGVPGNNVAAYYQRRAAGGVGLIITEGTYIDHRSSGPETGVPHLSTEASRAGWRKVVEAVHKSGGRIFVQLWHIGLNQIRHVRSVPAPEGSVDLTIPLVGPSGIDGDGAKLRDPLTIAEIDELIAAYGRTAGWAREIGFDGIEIHGAHGYLVDQFLWERTNQRGDSYGGDLVSRTRFAVEVIKECRRTTGSAFPISFRYSQYKVADFAAKLASSPTELGKLLSPLVLAGVDVFHCSTRRFWEPEFANSDLNLAGWTKKITGLPTITVGSVGLNSVFTDRVTRAFPTGLDQLIMMLSRGDFDLVAVGRAIIANPDWPNLVREGRFNEIVSFLRSDADKALI